MSTWAPDAEDGGTGSAAIGVIARHSGVPSAPRTESSRLEQQRRSASGPAQGAGGRGAPHPKPGLGEARLAHPPQATPALPGAGHLPDPAPGARPRASCASSRAGASDPPHRRCARAAVCHHTRCGHARPGDRQRRCGLRPTVSLRRRPRRAPGGRPIPRRRIEGRSRKAARTGDGGGKVVADRLRPHGKYRPES